MTGDNRRASPDAATESTRADTAPKPFVFVLMPFEPAFDDVYELGIKPACQAAGAYCERVDEQIFDGTILERIYNQIAKADLVVADMTGRNPNVFYEAGYAHALGKRTILLTSFAGDIPFDLQHYPHVVYEGRIGDLHSQLERRVAFFVSNPDIVQPPNLDQLEVYSGGRQVTERTTVCAQGGVVVVSDSNGTRDKFEFLLSIDLRNASRATLQKDEVCLALVLPSAYSSDSYPSCLMPEERVVLDLGGVERLFPNAWHSIRVPLARQDGREVGRVPAKLRVLTALDCKDYPFTIIAQTAWGRQL